MDCKGLEQLLSSKLLAELTPEQRAEAEAHLARCDACRDKWDPAYQSQEFRQALHAPRSFDGAVDDVMAKLDAQEPGPKGANKGPATPKRLGGFDLLDGMPLGASPDKRAACRHDRRRAAMGTAQDDRRHGQGGDQADFPAFSVPIC